MRRHIRTAVQLCIVIGLATSVSGCSYNKFTGQEEAIKAQWAQVQNQLQRRNDLIPNLVETVKGYATHEEAVFLDFADSLAKLDGAQTPDQPL
jgi:LemA protein